MKTYSLTAVLEQLKVIMVSTKISSDMQFQQYVLENAVVFCTDSIHIKQKTHTDQSSEMT